MFLSAVISGILLGGLYATMGIGLSLIYGIMKIINVSFGDLMILAAYFMIYFASLISGNYFIGFAITLVIMIIVGFLMQHFLINRVVGKSEDAPLLLTFGLCVIIENVLTSIFTADVRGIPNAIAQVNLIDVGNLKVSLSYALVFAVALAMVIVLTIIVNRTKFGRAVKATSQNARVAELLGVDTKRIFTYVMCIAMVVVCISGLLLGQTFAFTPYTGGSYLVIAMGVVIIGGMGSLPGTLLGGIVLGLAQLLGGYFFGGGWQTFIGYFVMLVLVIVRPQGLIPTKERI